MNNSAPSWPNRIGSGKLDNPDRQLWFNPNDFVAPPPNTYGNVARGVLYGPGQVSLDISFVKNNKFKERYNVQFRLDTFNLTNTPYFGFPNASIGVADSGADHLDQLGQPRPSVRAEVRILKSVEGGL